jgi:hypothetical protein
MKAGSIPPRSALASLAGAHTLLQWLRAEREAQIKTLTSALDVVFVHRAQGRVQLLDHMISLVEAGQNLQ